MLLLCGIIVTGPYRWCSLCVVKGLFITGRLQKEQSGSQEGQGYLINSLINCLYFYSVLLVVISWITSNDWIKSMGKLRLVWSAALKPSCHLLALLHKGLHWPPAFPLPHHGCPHCCQTISTVFQIIHQFFALSSLWTIHFFTSRMSGINLCTQDLQKNFFFSKFVVLA